MARKPPQRKPTPKPQRDPPPAPSKTLGRPLTRPVGRPIVTRPPAPKPAQRSKPRRSSARRPVHATWLPTAAPDPERPWERTLAVRELFWHNVVREVLTSLAVLSAERDARPKPGREQRAERPDAQRDDRRAQTDDILDGRLAVITSAGVRVPIAHITPVFACGVPGTPTQRALSLAVECTVFQVTSPSGEQHTLPLHEIRALHALTGELMDKLERAADAENRERDGQTNAQPFGFAAFTSLARSAIPPDQDRPDQPAPDEPDDGDEPEPAD